MTEVSQILDLIDEGDPTAASQLLPLVYDELKNLAAIKMRNEAPGHTLQATALVHDAYLRLVGNESDQAWNSRGHFFAAAAESMLVALLRSPSTATASLAMAIGMARAIWRVPP